MGMFYRLHVVPDLSILVACLLVQLHLSYWVIARPGWRSKSRLVFVLAGNLLTAALLLAGYLLAFGRAWVYVPSAWGQWLEAAGLILSMALIGLYLGILVWRTSAKYQPPRRKFLQAVGASLAVAPYVATTIGIINRD